MSTRLLSLCLIMVMLSTAHAQNLPQSAPAKAASTDAVYKSVPAPDPCELPALESPSTEAYLKCRIGTLVELEYAAYRRCAHTPKTFRHTSGMLTFSPDGFGADLAIGKTDIDDPKLIQRIVSTLAKARFARTPKAGTPPIEMRFDLATAIDLDKREVPGSLCAQYAQR